MSDVERSTPGPPDAGVPDATGRGETSPFTDRERGDTTVRPVRRWWLAPLVTGLSMAALLGFLTWQVVVRGPAIAWDWPLHTYVDPRQPDGVPRELLNAVASLGGQRLYTLPILVAVGLFVAWKQRSIRVLVAVGSGLATVFFVGYWIKFSLARTPPHTGVDILHGEGQAFPSGHTANATLTWVLIVIILFGSRGWRPDRRLFRRWIPAAIAIVFVSGMLMTLLDYHWLSDIPGGWILGGLALSVATAVLRAPIPWPALTWPPTLTSEVDQGHRGSR